MSTSTETFTSLDTSNSVDNVDEKVDKQEQLKDKSKLQLELLKADHMQKISNVDFLQMVSFENRLKNITDPNIDASKISENSEIIFNFSFTNDTLNENLYLMTTAGQVLPQTVQSVTVSKKTYSRNSLTGEFFTDDGKRLIIHDNTQLVVGKLRTAHDIADIQKTQEKYISQSGDLTDKNKDLLTQGVQKGFDTKTILSLFTVFFKGVENITSSMQEDFFTQIDREIGYMNTGEQRIDKDNIGEKSKDELAARMGNQEMMHSVIIQKKQFPELINFAQEYNIKNPEFLFAIYDIESSSGRNVTARKESRGRESLGMFQILNTNLTPELARELKQNPTDRNVNMRALRHYFDNNISLVTAINNNDFHKVASIYNGAYYEELAEKKGYTPYDEKLKSRVAQLRQAA